MDTERRIKNLEGENKALRRLLKACEAEIRDGNNGVPYRVKRVRYTQLWEGA